MASGEIDYADLRRHLMANKDKPAIINANIGTTVKGAVDDLDKVCLFCRSGKWVCTHQCTVGCLPVSVCVCVCFVPQILRFIQLSI